LTSSNRFSTRHQRFACARLSQPCLTGSCPAVSATLTTMALTTAACGGLRPTPDCRSRRALLHLSYSYASPFGPAVLGTHGESPGGISPPGAPRTVREPLDSHGSRCSAVGTPATGFSSSTSSSCCHLASVGPQLRLNNAAPSVRLHYSAFIPTTSCSVPELRIGTLVLADFAACDFSLAIGAQVLPFRTKAWLSFAPPPCRMPLGPSQASPKLIPEEWPLPGFDIA
jgi:hypothetical protein